MIDINLLSLLPRTEFNSLPSQETEFSSLLSQETETNFINSSILLF
jgi:hypothetical protein